MAESELEIKFKWENNVSFEMLSKRDAEAVQTVVKADENTHLALIWSSLQSICQAYFQAELKKIGDEMKA